MRMRFTTVLTMTTLGFLTLALSGCQSEGTKFDVPGASASTSASAVPGSAVAEPLGSPNDLEHAPGIPPVIEAPAVQTSIEAPPLTPLEDARTAVEGIDEGIQRTSQEVLPEVVAPVVDAAKGQVNEAVGELGDGARRVADGVTQGVRQAAEEATQGVREKADGLKQSFRQATEDLSQKAKETTHRTTSDLLKKLKEGARETVKGAKEAVTPAAPAPTPAPAPAQADPR